MDIAQECRERLVTVRKSLELTQAEMAAALGLSLKAWNDLENGRSEARKIHQLAAERAAFRLAAEHGAIARVPQAIMDDLMRLASDVPSAVALAEAILTRAYLRSDEESEPVRERVKEALFQAVIAGRALRGEPDSGP